MATVSEVLRGISQGFVVLGGAAGLGREARRVLYVRPPGEIVAAIGSGDLVVYAGADRRRDGGEGVDRSLTALLSSGVSAVLTDTEPDVADVQAADRYGSPLLTSIGRIEAEQLYTLLVQSLDLSQSAAERQQADLQRELLCLSRAGATPSMLLERLVGLTGKAGFLQRRHPRVDETLQPVLQELDAAVLRRAIDSSDQATQRWLVDTADATVNNLLYLELPVDHLVRLVAPVWIDDQAQAAVSLFARSDEVAARDRMALLAAARAIATANAEDSPVVAVGAGRRRIAAVVVHAAQASLAELAAVAGRLIARSDATLAIGRDDVRMCLAYKSSNSWEWRCQVGEWQAQLSAELGTVSLGHALRWGADAHNSRHALVQAAEAMLVGDHLFRPGHVTGYADAHLAKFLLGARDAYELRALYEHAIGKLATEDLKSVRRDSELVATLDVYCETLSTQGTAERLQVHRNTVLYRIKRIEQVTSMDLGDGASRLFLQLGLQAGRLARGTDGARMTPDTFHPTPLLRVGPKSSPTQARTA